MSKLLAILLELGTAMKVPKEKLTPLFEDKDGNALTEDSVDTKALEKLLKDAHREALSTVSQNMTFDKKKVQEEAYKSAERKLKSEIESVIKDKFDLDDTTAEKLEDLIDEAATKTTTSGKKGEISDSDVKTHAAYVQMEKQYKKQIAEQSKAHTEALTTLETTHKREKAFGTVSNKGLELFDSFKPVLSADAEKAKNQRAHVAKLLSEYEYDEVEGETIIMKGGEVLLDEMKNKVTLEDHVKNLTSPIFDFQVSNPKGSPNGGQGGQNGSEGGQRGAMKYTGVLPKNMKEVVSMVNDEKIPLDNRVEIQAWADAQGESFPAE